MGLDFLLSLYDRISIPCIARLYSLICDALYWKIKRKDYFILGCTGIFKCWAAFTNFDWWRELIRRLLGPEESHHSVFVSRASLSRVGQATVIKPMSATSSSLRIRKTYRFAVLNVKLNTQKVQGSARDERLQYPYLRLDGSNATLHEPFAPRKSFPVHDIWI